MEGLPKDYLVVRPAKETRLIKKMPSRELLEEYLRGVGGEVHPVRVTFNHDSGQFERNINSCSGK